MDETKIKEDRIEEIFTKYNISEPQQQYFDDLSDQYLSNHSSAIRDKFVNELIHVLEFSWGDAVTLWDSYCGDIEYKELSYGEIQDL